MKRDDSIREIPSLDHFVALKPEKTLGCPISEKTMERHHPRCSRVTSMACRQRDRLRDHVRPQRVAAQRAERGSGEAPGLATGREPGFHARFHQQ